MMTPEKHLANILQTWHETDGETISLEMQDALKAAEADFDGVEAEPEIDLNHNLYNAGWRDGYYEYHRDREGTVNV